MKVMFLNKEVREIHSVKVCKVQVSWNRPWKPIRDMEAIVHIFSSYVTRRLDDYPCASAALPEENSGIILNKVEWIPALTI